MNKENEIIVETKKYAEDLLSKKIPNTLTYHTLEHTYDVVGAVSVIGLNENLAQDELEIVLLAG